MLRISLALLILLTSCGWHPHTEAYRQLYTHPAVCHAPQMEETPYFLVILVNARHLDYTDAQSFFKTLAKHPSDGSKNGDVGHAWIYLRGEKGGKPVSLEGGHTGEFGMIQPTYMEGILNYMEWGYCNPTDAQRQHPRLELNPVKYLWEPQLDGHFQKGSGGHHPTFAAKVNLSPCQYERILAFIEHYDFRNYSLTENQCSTFVVSIAEIAGLILQDKVTMRIPQFIKMSPNPLWLWTDPRYQTLSFSSPDILEKSLKQAVADGQAENALTWYRRHLACESGESLGETLRRFPERLQRLFL